MRILMVEDDGASAQFMGFVLRSEGIDYDETDLGEKAVELATANAYDLITLDLNLPDISGLEVLRRLRIEKINTPVMIVSGTTDLEEKVKTYGGGANAYLEKPFNRDLFIARIREVVRKSQGVADAVLRNGNIAVNIDTKTVEVNGVPIKIRGKQYQILELLSLRKAITLSKEALMAYLYSDESEWPEPKIIDVFVCHLRKKIAAANNGEHHIVTEWGRGYRFIEPEVAA